jgi:peptidoglycan-associated lipoprotein
MINTTMKTISKIIFIGAALGYLTGCTSTSGIGSSQSPDPNQPAGYEYNTRGNESGFGYDQNNPNGQNPGGNTAVATSSDRIIYFEFDSATVRSDAMPIVQAQGSYLLSNPNLAVILEGHADERGTREYNIGLGEQRGEAVRRLLIAQGVAPQQISVVSYGEERPAVAGQDEYSYAQNRRVEIVY